MWVFVVLLFFQLALSTLLSLLNIAHLKRVAANLAPEWAERLDVSRFPQMIAYTVANTRLGTSARLVEVGITLAILVSGLLPALAQWALALGNGPTTSIGLVWRGLLVLAVPALISYAANIPWDLVSDFRIEKRFGFSTITLKTWLTDQAKSLLIAAFLGILLGGGLLLLIDWLDWWWWLPAWIGFALFQLLMTLIAPTVLLPMFNRFEPLQDQELGQEINELARQASFPLAGVFQMDASRRTTHSNAFFIGLGKTRRIVLFDTLLEQLSRSQILAVLAHEIGHWKKRHILFGVVAGIAASGVGLIVVATLLDIPWLYEVVGAGNLFRQLGAVGPVAAIGLYLIGVLLSPLELLLSPLANWASRRREYQADAYAIALYRHPGALEEALIQLTEENLSNLFPHPWVVVFRYSHPPLLQRIAAIRKQAAQGTGTRQI